MSDISVVIPCIPKHLKHLDELIISICEQSILPHEVIISLSDYNNDDSKQLEEHYCNAFPKLMIKIVNKVEPAYAGENRNRGCASCTTKYVTFMDADDIMSSHKLETLVDLFNEHDMDAIIHTYGDHPTNELFDDTIMKNVKKKSHSIWLNHALLGLINIIHHGHITIKKSVFDIVQQDTSSKRVEDSDYVRRIIDADMKLYLIDKNLSIYRPHLSSSK
jgi:glycosyltransferase involved in cell wall biosynthesis